jgi:phage terminase large subunit
VSTVDDTKAIPRSLIEADRELYHAMYGDDAGDALIEQEYFCSFAAAVLGAYYGKAINRLEDAGRIRALEYDPRLPVHTVWDLGKGANMAVLVFQAAPDGFRILYALQGAHDEVMPDLVRRLNALPIVKWGNDYVPHDAKVKEIGTGKTRVETLVALGRKPVLVPNHKIDDGISAARLLLPKCWIDATNCEPALEAWRNYKAEWDPDRRVFKNTPLHDWSSHFADALRYLAMVARELLGAITPPKSEHEKLVEAMKRARGVELLATKHDGQRAARDDRQQAIEGVMRELHPLQAITDGVRFELEPEPKRYCQPDGPTWCNAPGAWRCRDCPETRRAERNG